MAIKITTDVERAYVLANRFRTKGQEVRNAIYAEALNVAEDLKEYIIENKLSGDPLNRKTGNLQSAIMSEVSVLSGDVILKFGANSKIAPYWAVHEYGGSFIIPEHLRRTKYGVTTVRQHIATFRERSYIRSGIREFSDQIKPRLQEAANKVLNAITEP